MGYRETDEITIEKIKERMGGLRKLSRKKLMERRKNKLKKPVINPQYDAVYFDGLEWLNNG